VDAVFRDFYDEQNRYFDQPIPEDVIGTNWSIVEGGARVLNNTLNNTGMPDIGILHGPVIQGYFHHIQRVVNEGGTFGDISATDIREHLGLLSPTKMFEGNGTVCPVKEIFIAAAIGVGRKTSPTGVRSEQRLWSIYQRAQHEAGELQQHIISTLRSPFDMAINNMRGNFVRPTPRVMSPTSTDDLSRGQK
ncbi:MAG: hypothetical protein K2Q32_07510, partial [Alphaproteobacteria bacterium]|nr:hypothetical protein [Alphaproteobacteria bacterium]